MSVDLPEPDGPMIAVNSPRANVTSTPASASHGGLPAAVDLAQPGGADGGGGQRRRWLAGNGHDGDGHEGPPDSR